MSATPTYSEYEDLEGVRWSDLKEMDKSAAHFRYRLGNPRQDTPALAFGRAVHTAVLQPDRFPLEYVVYDGGMRRGRAWDEFEAANEGRTILKASEYQTCLAVRDAVHACPDAARLLIGESELVRQWIDPATGLACKARLDHLSTCIVDLKTTATTDAWRFGSTAARLLYHGQLAYYCMAEYGGIDEITAETAPRIIAVESDPPHDVAVFRLTDDALLAGAQKARDLLAHVAVCTERDDWPGRFVVEQDLALPSWIQADPDEGGWGDLPVREGDAA